MKWPWNRRTDATGESESGAGAREAAEQVREQARERWHEVLDVAEEMRELRERNHFAEKIEQSMKGRRR